MSHNSGDTGGEDRGQGPDEEFLRKLFGEAFGENSDQDKDEDPKPDNGPSIGFTGTPGSGSSSDKADQGGFPGIPGFDPSQLPFAADPAMMQQIMGQVQAMFSAMQNQEDGETVNWDIVESAALAVISDDDPAVSPAEAKQIDDALRLAEMWLNEATSFEALGQIGQGLTRRQWIQLTFESWKVLTEPVAEAVGRALGSVVRQQLNDDGAGLPEELKSMLPPGAAEQVAGTMERMGGVAFGAQVGQAIGELAREVHSGSDIGLPMAGQSMGLLPANIRDFGSGLQVEHEEILLYLALREAARIRLFARAPWLEDDLFNAVAQYAAGIHINMERIEEAAQSLDPSDPAAMEAVFGDGLFRQDRTPMQEAALRRIETTLALVEGWVDDVVAQAGAHLPSIEKLRETTNRRRATGGPAEDAFAALVGLELRPRRLRDAAALWAHLRETAGIEGRDDVWAHPDVQPEEQDLDDPSGFFSRREEREAQSASMDEELRKLLDGDYESGTDTDGPQDGPGGESR